MDDTATPETEPVEAPASMDDIINEIAADEGGGDALNEVTEQLVNEAEGESDSIAEPETEEEVTEPADEQPSEDEAPPEENYTVKVNGEDVTVPLSELLKGYSRNEDYKAKTTAVAEERRAIEAQRATLETDLKAEYANQLEEVTNLFAQYDPVLQEARTLNWEALKAQDPAAYLQAQDAVQARVDAIQQMQERVKQARGEAQQGLDARSAEERAHRFDATAEELTKVNPELADEAKFVEFAQSNINALKERGFTGEEINDTLDHRVLLLADDARKWQEHVAAQKSLSEKKTAPKSALKPLSGSSSRTSKPRMPNTSSREKRADWVVQQLLEDQ